MITLDDISVSCIILSKLVLDVIEPVVEYFITSKIEQRLEISNRSNSNLYSVVLIFLAQMIARRVDSLIGLQL